MNGEMDFMILNNKVKGVQGTVDNIDESIGNLQNDVAEKALESSVQEIKTIVNDLSLGDAKESSVQAVLSKLSETNGTSRPSVVASNTVLATISVGTAYTKSTSRLIGHMQVRNLEGIIRLSIAAYGENAYAKVYLNGTAIYACSSTSSSTQTYTKDIYVTPGSIITFEHGTNNTNKYAYCSSVSVCGSITGDGSVVVTYSYV